MFHTLSSFQLKKSATAVINFLDDLMRHFFFCTKFYILSLPLKKKDLGNFSFSKSFCTFASSSSTFLSFLCTKKFNHFSIL